MEQLLDEALLGGNTDKVINVTYGGFWPRLGALIVDGLIFLPITIGISFLNLNTLKSSFLLIFVNILSLVYKPVMEIIYGATLGKMALNLTVVNVELHPATAINILLRNVFDIVPSLITLVVTIGVYRFSEFAFGFGNINRFFSDYQPLQYLRIVVFIVMVIDAVVLLSDSRKRSWHDKIGGTCVIEKPRRG